MDTIALPEWSPNLITERSGWGGCGADQYIAADGALMAELNAASIKTERYGS
jgi:hypothetical protein